jgi:hypothetical protein
MNGLYSSDCAPQTSRPLLLPPPSAGYSGPTCNFTSPTEVYNCGYKCTFDQVRGTQKCRAINKPLRSTALSCLFSGALRLFSVLLRGPAVSHRALHRAITAACSAHLQTIESQACFPKRVCHHLCCSGLCCFVLQGTCSKTSLQGTTQTYGCTCNPGFSGIACSLFTCPQVKH